MAQPLPLACTLDAAALGERTAAMRRIGERALVSAHSDGGHAELRFAPDARPEVEAIVAAEAECCAFLTMDLRDAGDELVLTVAAPARAEAVVDGLVAAFATR